MLKLIKAKITARKATQVLLKKEIPMLNGLIAKAADEGKFCVSININDYSSSAQVLLKKAGYKVEYNHISWAHHGVEVDKDEKTLMEIAKEAGVEIIEMQ